MPPAIDWAVKWNLITDPAEQKMIWSARKAAVPLLFRMPGKKQPVPFIEDVAVPVEKFPEYIHGLEAILGRYGTPVCYFAHAGHGECHTRPYLDLHDPAEVDKMCAIAKETYQLVWSLGGTISGEHGEGLSRGGVHQAPVRAALRPDARRSRRSSTRRARSTPARSSATTRTSAGRTCDSTTRPGWTGRGTKLVFRGEEFVDTIEKCNGNGECRTREAGGTMCPIFRVVGEEDASPRAHANMMRHYITGLLAGGDPRPRRLQALRGLLRQLQDVPDRVPVGGGRAEADAGGPRAVRRAARPDAGGDDALAGQAHEHPEQLHGADRQLHGAISSRSAALLEKVGGVDRRRQLPRFDFGSFLWRYKALANEAATGARSRPTACRTSWTCSPTTTTIRWRGR